MITGSQKQFLKLTKKLLNALRRGSTWSSLFLHYAILFSLIHKSFQDECEPKVIKEDLTEPYNDFSEITSNAATLFSTYLSLHTGEDMNELHQMAKTIASDSLLEDDGFLAFSLAAPSIQLAVVQFRDQIEYPVNDSNHTFLKTYWRQMGAAWNMSKHRDVGWGYPFRDCGPLRGKWLWPFSTMHNSSYFKVVASAFIGVGYDPCIEGLEEIYGKKHNCDPTTFCLASDPSVSSKYTCICKSGYYFPNQTLQGFESDVIEAETNGNNFSCILCPGTCVECDAKGVCSEGAIQDMEYLETLIKTSIGAVLGACMLCCTVLFITVFRQRKCKTIATGMWTILETILIGSFLLYAAVGLHFFQASTIRCLLEPWLRELGFVVCYGAITLKLYRHLVEFRTRKAHRWVVRDVDLLKYLFAVIVAVLCYLSAFTASSLDFLEHGNMRGLEEERTNTCRPLKWDYVTQSGEILILLFGLHLGFASRNATTQFRERQFLVASIFIEFVVSANFYVLRALYLPELSPAIIFLALFLRSQLTNTVTLALIFLPKLWYQQKQGSHEFAHHGLGGGSGGAFGYCPGICIGDPDIGELTISEMTPEDIRAELKRLYTQLEILKNKTLRQDNPHISKRRGGRKVAHRRFSLQALSSKHRHAGHNNDIEVTEASRTPEDSVCSAEGPTDTGEQSGGISVPK